MSPPLTTPSFPFALGCPVWSSDAWTDIVYPAGTPRRDWLSWYSRMFNTVEGNSTFYALPTVEVAKRWAAESADGFHFVLKFPREISHAALLQPSNCLDRFIEIISVLDSAQRAGPAFLQLPPWFDRTRCDELCAFLELLPPGFAWAVEPRHASWFGDDPLEYRFNDMLLTLGMDRVILDSRALFQSPPDDESEAKSHTRKPNLPIRFIRTGKRPIVRLVGRNRVQLADRFVAQWLPVINQWIKDGCRPYLFTHTPDDKQAPSFARRIAAAFSTQYGKPHLLPMPPTRSAQMRLFE